MRSKTLISYQKGYCGQPADIEAMKPREARAYCLGVGHVAAGTLPLGSGAEVLAALSTRRRDVGDGEAAATAAAATVTVTQQQPTLRLIACSSKIECVKALRDVAYSLNISRELSAVVGIVNSIPYVFTCRSESERELAIRVLRSAGAVVEPGP